jgi:SAM-dependent methyltransferase
MSDVNDIGYGRQLADFYDRLYPPGELVDQAVAWLASLHPGGGLPSLELGVGTGRIAMPLAERIGQIVGVDSSPEMLDVLRATLEAARQPDADPWLRVHRPAGSAGYFPFPRVSVGRLPFLRAGLPVRHRRLPGGIHAGAAAAGRPDDPLPEAVRRDRQSAWSATDSGRSCRNPRF